MLQQDMHTCGFIRLPQVLKLIPVSKTTWWDGIRKGIFPAPVHLTPRTTAWRVEDIRNYIESHAQGGGKNV